MSVTLPTTTVDGVEVPRPGVWEIDPSHSAVGFVARHLVVAKVRGRFGAFAGAITITDPLEESRVDVSIDAASIDTREPQRDAHLRSADFFDVDNHPALTFSGSGPRRIGGRDFELDGTLTIRGVTKPVTLRGTYDGITLDPWGNARAVFSARTEIDREAWGLTWNQALETGGVLVSKHITIEIEVEAVYKG